jgi:hypothetical protein
MDCVNGANGSLCEHGSVPLGTIKCREFCDLAVELLPAQ